jgi:glycosyltransferase involved in cell wall biosynthesis
MKIAFINQPWNSLVLPVQSASVAIWTYEVARRLSGLCDVVVYGKRGAGQQPAERYEGVSYRRTSVKLDTWLRRVLEPLPLFRNARRPFFASRLNYLLYGLKIALDLRKQTCDIVHIHNLLQLIPIIKSLNPSVKISLHMHCEWLTQLDRSMVIKRISKTDLIIGCSDYITHKVKQAFPELSERCHTVFNGVDIDFFHKKDDPTKLGSDGVKRLLFVGRITPEKGLHVLLEAFRYVSQYFPNVQLCIVGQHARTPAEYIIALSDDPPISKLVIYYRGSYLAHLLDQLTGDMASRINFCGFVPHANLVEYYCSADLLLNPSLSESFGMSLIEAMACELPVLATRTGGMTEIVDEGKTGVLVEPGNAAALAATICSLLADEERRRAMGKASRQRVIELFSWDKIAAALWSHYKSIADVAA